MGGVGSVQILKGWANPSSSDMCLGVDFPFFSTIDLFKTSCFPRVFGGFLARSIPGKNGEATLRMCQVKGILGLLVSQGDQGLPKPTRQLHG